MNLTCAAANVNGAALPILIIHLVPNLIIASARGASRLLAGFRDEVRVLPLGPGAVFRPHRVGWQTELEDSVFTAGKFQHKQALRRAKIKFDVASAHAGVFRCVRMPVTRHRHPIERCVKLRLNFGKAFDGLAGRRFNFKFEQRRRAIDVQNMRLSRVPNSKYGCGIAAIERQTITNPMNNQMLLTPRQ